MEDAKFTADSIREAYKKIKEGVVKQWLVHCLTAPFCVLRDETCYNNGGLLSSE